MNTPLPGDEAPQFPRAERELLEEANRLNQELSALVAITDDAISTLDLEELLKVLMKRLMHVMKADAGAILLEEGGGLVVRATTGFHADVWKRPALPIGEGFGGRIFVTGEPMYIADAQNDPRIHGTFLREQGIVSMLGVPLRTRELLVGVLHVDWCQPHAESASDVRLLATAAERCATAIVKARLFAELRAAHVGAERVSERLTLALGAADLGVWDLDVPSQSVVWDANNERIFGLGAGSFDGRYETFERLIHPDDLASVRTAIGAALEGAPFAHSFRIVRPDGGIRWLSARGHFQRTPEGKPLRLLGVTSDVTEEKQRAEERELLLARERQAREEAERADERLRSTNEQLRALSARIQTVREEEAVRIAREIHDELGQLLTALRMDVSWIRSRVARIDSNETVPLLARADDMAELTERTIRTVQRISEELRPSALDELGLEAAIEALLTGLAERSSIATSLVGTLGDRRLDSSIETGVFRIVQELLTNVARHSEASAVRVELRLEGTEGELLGVHVSDDGRGIRPAELADPRSLGLAGIRERALLLGGMADFRGEPGGGTEARVIVPCAGVRAP
jgi:two-component system, NarL family, sensor histidine kinase UhpB